jgi:hypothetical protein
MKRFIFAGLFSVVGAFAGAALAGDPAAPGGAVGIASAKSPATGRHPMAVQAESSFFTALEETPATRDAALGELLMAYGIDSTDGRTATLLGLGHLWAAAEGGDRNPKAIEHLLLAERFLTRAGELNPTDDRIPSWLMPARMALAGVERRPDRFPELYAGLIEAYGRRPAFHSFSVGLVNSHQKPGTPRFEEGLKAVRSAYTVCRKESPDRSCGNPVHAPHNREGFALFAAAYEVRAGNLPEAAELLEGSRGLDSYASWPYRERSEELRVAVAAALKGDSAAMEERTAAALKTGGSCRACHGSK